MEDELEEYLSNIGLSTSMLKSTSAAQLDDDVPATAPCSDDERHDDDNDVVVAAESSEPAVDVIADDDETRHVISTTVLAGDDDEDDDDDGKVLDVTPTVTESLTNGECSTVADCPPTQADCDSRSQQLIEPLSSDNSDDVSQPTSTCTLQVLSSADNNNSVQSSQQQTVTVNGNVVLMDHNELADSVSRQSNSSRSAVVFSTIPRHVHAASTLPISQTSQLATSSSSSTIMLSGSTTDVVRSSPTTQRATVDNHERSQSDVARRASPDTASYTSTIIRCSTSSAPVIATSINKPRDMEASRDMDAPAVDGLESRPAAKPQVKTTPNYVSVIQVGAVPSPTTTERRVIPVMMTPVDPLNGGAVIVHSSPRHTARQHTNMSDVASCTPIKSSLKKVSPKHNKSKSVSFSAGSADDNDDNTTTVSTVRQADAQRPGLAEAIVRLDRDRVDGIAPRRALVSDSGVFCELDDDQAPLNSDDYKPTGTQPSRRTTVIVSGGMTSIKNSAKHHQRQQLADLAGGPELHSESIDMSLPTGSVRLQQVPAAPSSSASAYVSDNMRETKHVAIQDTTPDSRRTKSDSTQASCAILLLLMLRSE